MNAEQSLMLARRFIELPLEKRRLFLKGLHEENLDFSVLPIPAGVAAEDRDAPSYAQRRMWFLWQLEPQSGAYNLPCAVRLRGGLDEAALQRAFADLMARHETLRTVFRRRDDDSLYLAPLVDEVRIERADLSALEVTVREVRVREEAEQQSWLPFDLEQGPLLRIRLLRLADDEHVLLLTLHHIVADGWSMNLLVDELARLYDGHALGAPAELPALPIQYADYALWQRRWLEAGEQERQLDYWHAHLGEEHTPLALPSDRPRPAVASHRGTRHEFTIDAKLAEGLRGLARAHGISLFMLLLGAFGILLQRYSGQADIRVGVPIANRTRSETEGLIGFFVNTQVLRLRLDGRLGLDEYLQHIREITLGAQDHQELPFERLVEAFNLERSLSHNPLFQVMYNHQPQVADISALQTDAGLTFSQIDWRSRTTQFDLTLDTYERGGKLQAALTYADDLFDADTIERMARHLNNLWRTIVADPRQRIADLPMLDEDERLRIVRDWNATATNYPLECPIHRLIEAQVERTPQAPALFFTSRVLSYTQLNARANRLAHKLIELGVGPDVLVGIAVERSIEMVVGLLAILKAGGAYVPLDPQYPAERLAYMLDDSGVRLLLGQSHLELPLAEGVQRIDLDQDDDWLEGYAEHNPSVALDGENLAYVIYTSGSTGKPKGAGNRHSALTNRLCWMQQAYGLDGSDTVLQKTPFSFDVSVWEFFWPLMTGARLVVAAPGDHRDPAKLIELIDREGVTTLHFVPSMLQAFLQDDKVSTCTCLKRIVCSGEALPVDAQQQVFAKLPQAGLYNLYGPTEAAIDVTHWTCKEEGKDAVPIGQPIANLGCHILDGDLQPVPVGVLGELYLAGAGLARGYHQRPALTAERFVTNPFDTGTRMYRTGDLARYRADGVIEYLGRIDHQVKLRGLRIELGEIEVRLLKHEQVREAIVLAVDGKQLVGYVVLANEAEDWREELTKHLKHSLPDYMVPTQWIRLECMPLSPNGKLERKALPKPEAHAVQREYAAPQGVLEQRIAAVWQDVLGRERIGRNDNFFELGGDSIVSIQIVSRARQAGIRFTPKDLFQYQTVRSLASVAELGSESRIHQGPVVGEVVLTPVQRWFFEQPMSRRNHWNQSLLLNAQQPIVPEILEKALQSVVQHHDALRLRFVSERGEWHQWYTDAAAEQNLLWHGPDSTAFYGEVQRSLDLTQGPLLRAALLQGPEGEQRLLLAIHHLVVDGVSWRILLEDLQVAYRSLAAGQTPTLPAKTSSYQAWAARLEEYAKAEQRQPKWADWLSRLEGSVQELPRDNPDGGLLNQQGATLDIRLDAEHTERLLKEAPAAYRTQVNDLLLTALARVLCRWSGHESVLVQMEGHGREDLFEDIDLTRTLGWFTSLYPVKLMPARDFAGSVKAVKEQLRGMPDKGLGYGLLRYLGTPEAQQALAGLPQPRVTFNYLGQFDGQFDEQALFVPTGQGGGKAQAEDAPLANWLTVEGQVYGGELSLRWGYSSEMYRRETIQQLADELLAELYAVIEHCTSTDTFAVTPSDFPLATLTQAQLDVLPVSARDIEDLYPLSPMQQGMLFHTLYGQGGDYINQMRVDVDGLDVERFRVAWEATVAAHDILRTGFVWQGLEIPVQVVRQLVEVPFAIHDWRGQPLQAQALDTLAEAERGQGFELSLAPLLCLVLVRTDEQRYHLIYTHHHILMDGWSNAQLLGEVLQRYAGQTPLVPMGHYRDYIAWLQSQDKAASEAFWRAQLAELDEPTRLAQAVRAERHDGEGYGEQIQVLDREQTQRISKFARAHKVTVNTLLQAAWLLLLQRYTGQETVAFGATVAGRPAELRGMEQQLGLFINTLPVIATPRPDMRVDDWLQAVQSQNLALREHEHTPLYEIQRWAGLGGEALFDSILVFENYPIAEVFQQSSRPSGLSFGEVRSHEQTNYPLTLAVGLGETLSIHYRHDRAKLGDRTVQQIASHFNNLLDVLIRDTAAALGELPLLSSKEYQQIVYDWSHTETSYFSEKCIHQLIEVQVERTPEAVALVCGDQELSYRELNRRANRLAYKLREFSVGPDVLVGIAVERSLEMVVGLLGILKAGGAYVPLDPEYPQDRLAYMLEDSGIRLLLTQKHLREQLPIPEGVHSLELEVEADWLAGYGETNLETLSGSESLAYVIYTSGSTGRPKGAAVRVGSFVNLLHWYKDTCELSSDDRVLLLSSYAFDLTQKNLYGVLCVGGQLHLPTPGYDPEECVQQIERHRLTLVNCAPSTFHPLLHGGYGRLRSLRHVLLGGEAIQPGGLADWLSAPEAAGITLYNTYGPTECTDVVIAHATKGVDIFDMASLPIGRPLPGVEAHILSSSGEPLAAGLVGELHIGGDCVGDGYWGRAGLTAERFVPDPFDKRGGRRLYRTGDFSYWRNDGLLEYVGRVDHQVKVRGFRIELGEIAAHLLELEVVRDAAVDVYDSATGKALVGYVVPVSAELSPETLRDSLREGLLQRLPDYMVPQQWLFLDALPLSPNGKLDRKALPAPDTSLLLQTYEAPQNMLQRQLASIWCELLGLEQVGLRDNFFDLGGHSLLATQVISRVRHARGVDLPLRSLFEARDLEDFAAAVEACDPVDKSQRALILKALDPTVRQPLSYAQQRLWFLWQLEPYSSMYNIPRALQLDGMLEVEAVRASFEALVQRHSVLRTTYIQESGGSWQQVQPQMPLPLVFHDLRELSQAAQEATIAEALAKQVQAPFDLVNGPLLRVSVLRLAEQQHILLVTLHHIVADYWSFGILLREFVAFYDAAVGNTPAPLPAVGPAYLDFAVWQRQWLEAGQMQRQLDYWRRILGDDHQLTRLPGTSQTDVAASTCQVHAFEFPTALANSLRTAAKARGLTLYMLLLAGFSLVVAQRCDSTQVRLGTDVANRNHVGLEDMVGFFVNQLVLQLELDDALSVEQWFDRCRDVVVGASDHQDLPFDRLVEALRLPRQSGRSPLFAIKFIYQESSVPIQAPQGLQVTMREAGQGATELDLISEFVNGPESLTVAFKCDASLYTTADMHGLFAQLQGVFEYLLEMPQASLLQVLAQAAQLQASAMQAQAKARQEQLRAQHPIHRRARGIELQ